MNDSNEYRILRQEIDEVQKQVNSQDKYLKEITLAFAGVSVLLIFLFLDLYGFIDL